MSSGSVSILGLINAARRVLWTSTMSPSRNPRSWHKLLGITIWRPFPTRTVEFALLLVFLKAIGVA